MRRIMLGAALTAMAAVAACAPETSQQVNATLPTVSYRVAGSNLSQANENARQYCAQYGMAAQLESSSYSGIATYSCVAGPAGIVYGSNANYRSPSINAPGYAPPPGPVQCADWLHQGRPGGTDYYGPPVPGCPQL